MIDGVVALYIFMLAAIAGHVIISRVPVILHTPLMSGSNFIHGIVLIGAMVVLGHAEYYPKFGFVPASRFGIRAPFDVPDEAMMALRLDDARPVPSGTIAYPAAFGV